MQQAVNHIVDEEMRGSADAGIDWLEAKRWPMIVTTRRGVFVFLNEEITLGWSAHSPVKLTRAARKNVQDSFLRQTDACARGRAQAKHARAAAIRL
ncbi:hypothetical protein ACVWZ4_001026 [Bradyrhizobium sp. USDA 4472]